MFMYTCLRLNKSASISTSSSFLGYSIYNDLIRVLRRTDSDPALVMGCMGIKAISGLKDHIATILYETWFTLKLIYSVALIEDAAIPHFFFSDKNRFRAGSEWRDLKCCDCIR